MLSTVTPVQAQGLLPGAAKGAKTIEGIRWAGPALSNSLPRLIENTYWNAEPHNAAQGNNLGALLEQEQVALPAEAANPAVLSFPASSTLPKGVFVINSTKEVIPRISPQSVEVFLSDFFPLFQGTAVKNIEELTRLLGKEEKELIRAISGAKAAQTPYFVANPADGLKMANYLFLQRHFYSREAIPVIIALRSKEGGYFDIVGDFYFEEGPIPTQGMEVFAYLNHQGEDGWYHVSLTPQGKLVAVPIKKYLQYLDELSLKNK